MKWSKRWEAWQLHWAHKPYTLKCIWFNSRLEKFQSLPWNNFQTLQLHICKEDRSWSERMQTIPINFIILFCISSLTLQERQWYTKGKMKSIIYVANYTDYVERVMWTRYSLLTNIQHIKTLLYNKISQRLKILFQYLLEVSPGIGKLTATNGATN